jgi:hypothetical protein
MSAVGYALPGSLTIRGYFCGKTKRRCRTDPDAMHGPYAYWTRKVGSTTKTRVLTDAQLDHYREWFDNARRLKELVTELHELAVGVLDNGERSLSSERKATEAAPREPARHRSPR